MGESIVVARKSGDEWWVGAMIDRKPREARVPLEFLGEGRFHAEIYRDDLASKFRMAQRTVEVTAGDVIREPMAPSGGLLIHLSPSSREANRTTNSNH